MNDYCVYGNSLKGVDGISDVGGEVGRLSVDYGFGKLLDSTEGSVQYLCWLKCLGNNFSI